MICLRWWQLLLVFWAQNTFGEVVSRLTKRAIRRCRQGKEG